MIGPVAEIRLHGGLIALVDASAAHLVQDQSWIVQRVSSSDLKYARASGVYHNASLMHRLIAGAAQGEFIDHINGDGLDNRRSNLRICSHKQNMGNRGKSKNSGQPYKGIYLTKDKPRTRPWRARIGKEVKPLGYYETAEDAARAYDKAAIARYGEFALTNFKY